ncbi:MAG: hypothetical protein O8C56_07450, partial [Candidatus Methanoperedens sp.]|nr:hypothetical protein [Candidatus Methanoperedens sp.]
INVNDEVVNMECKHLKIDCVTRVIDQKWEEMRACECGVSCFYQDNPELTSISLVPNEIPDIFRSRYTMYEAYT